MTEVFSESDNDQNNSLTEKIKLDFWTLKFSNEFKEFENHFLLAFYSGSLNKVRFALLIAVIFYAVFGILDVYFIPEYKFKFWTIRYLIVIPLLLSILAFSFTRIFKRKIQFISSIVVFLSGISVIAIVWLSPADLNNYYYSGLILIIIMNYGLLRLRFVWASTIGILVSLAYIILSFNYIEMPFLQCVFNAFFLSALNIVGIFISREFEIYARKEYFSNQLLKIERMKLKGLNARLEAKIKDKASQLNLLQKEMMEENENSDAKHKE
jgi:hypothetical protein